MLIPIMSLVEFRRKICRIKVLHTSSSFWPRTRNRLSVDLRDFGGWGVRCSFRSFIQPRSPLFTGPPVPDVKAVTITIFCYHRNLPPPSFNGNVIIERVKGTKERASAKAVLHFHEIVFSFPDSCSSVSPFEFSSFRSLRCPYVSREAAECRSTKWQPSNAVFTFVYSALFFASNFRSFDLSESGFDRSICWAR